MTDTPLSDLCSALDLVVMERAGPGTFLVHGTPPAWLRRVNTRWKGERQVLASRTFPFLDHFLVDAEEFWATGTPGRVGSGLSSEPAADGGEFHFEAWAVTVEPEGQFLVLELKREGAELQSLLQRAREGRLERERLERTQEALTRSQSALQQAKAQAEAAAEAHAAVLRTITHEVRTPVHAIIGLAGLMLDAPLPPAQARFLSLIRGSSETLLTVLNDMLDASRLEAGELPLDERPFDVRETVEEALGAVSIRAGERGIDLTSQVELAVPETVVGDRGRWRLVLVTLVAHAVASASTGDVLVFVEATDQGEGRTEVHVAMSGGGQAGADPDLDRLLAVGDGVEGVPTPREGMGLLVCRALVERLGGRVWADRQSGGTTIHVTARFSVAAGPSSPYLRAHQPVLERRRAWIVGASPAVERLIIRELRFWGMTPRAARSVEETAAWVEADGPPDVVIVDRATLLDPAAADALAGPVVELVTLDRAHEAAARPVAALLTKPLRTSRLYACLVTLLASPV